MRKILFAFVLVVFAPLLIAQQALNNDSIMKLCKSGLSDDVIVTTINSSPADYKTAADDLVALKSAGASDKVIAAVVVRAVAPAHAAPAAVADSGASKVPAGIDSIGVYYQAKDGTWQEVVTEVVNMKTGGALKSFATHGLVKGDLNGNLKGGSSKLKLTAPANFIIYVPEGRSPGEYLLVRFRAHEKDREFRSATGGFVHSSSGATRDSADFESKKIAPRTYQITLGQDLGKGEYGFIPPTDTGNMGSAASTGRAYTFSIIE